MKRFARSVGIGTFAWLIAAAWSTGVLAAAPVCVDPGGIGGTGAPAHGGVGGTGAPARTGGLGGTGAPVVERGIGGTGSPVARPGIGGTGAPIASQGIGGTGAPAAGSGIGGTGAPLAGTPGGIGGTGAPAADGGLGGTGIVGTITGFASICVNGVEVHFEDTVPVTRNGVVSATAQLEIGQVVAVEAGTSGRGLEARRISILNAYEGPVTALASGGEPMRVMGQPVRLAANVQIDANVRVGDTVRVGGLRNAAGEVVATRVARAPDQTDASAIGTVDRTGSLRGLSLATTRATPGEELLVRGRWQRGALDVQQVSRDPSIPFAGRVERAVVEGLVHSHDAERITIDGFTIEFGAMRGGDMAALGEGRRIRAHGHFDGPRRIRADRIEFVRGEFGDRRGAGTSGDGGDDDGGKERSRTRVETDDDGTRIRSETRSEDGREKIEREFNSAGEIERERIDIRIESPTGELERRERIDVRESGGVIERRERIEIYEGGRRVDRIERVERIEAPDRVDKADRPERIERLDRSGKDD